MSESVPSTASRAAGCALLLAGLVALTVSILALLAVLFEGPALVPIAILVVGAAAALLALRGARRRLGRKVTFIGVTAGLVVFAGGYFAIVAPSLFTAMGRSKQKRTMADLRGVATAVEAYAIDHRAYPAASNLNELAALIEPTYIRSTPRIDGWGNPFVYRRTLRPDGTDSYTLASAGEDGRWEQRDLAQYKPGPTKEYGNDIVYSDGQFVVYPDGVQAR